METYAALFSPARIGKLLVKNRIVMSPMLVSYGSPDGQVTDNLLAYYEARARGGAGLIIVEAACVDNPTGRESFRQLSIDQLSYVAGLERLAQTIKKYSSRAFIQLFHGGRQTSQIFTGVQPVAPSPLPCPMIKEMPRQLELDEIQELEGKFVNAARFAHMAGFDGVELHAAHGYLINQFLSANANIRDDLYGGSLSNRMRFLLNIVKAIKEEVPELSLSVRLNLDDFVPGGINLEESIEICQGLEKAGVDIINGSVGTYESGLKSIEPASYQEGWRVYLAGEIKKWIKIPVISGGMLNNPAFANQLVESGQTDFVFLGRSLLADSEWPNKVRENRVEDIRPCIRCNNCIDHNFKGMMVDCTVNPHTGREMQFDYYLSGNTARGRAVVAGSGPAGMQAALSLSQLGLKVSLYEKDRRLGGLMNLAAMPPFKFRIGQLRDYLIRQIYKSNIEIILNHAYTLSDLQQDHPDYLVVATGSRPVVPPINGWNPEFCTIVESVLTSPSMWENKQVVVIGGGRSGCEVADYLLAGNNTITIIEQQSILAPGMDKKNRRDILDRLQKGQVKRKTGTSVTEIKPGEVHTIDQSGARDLIHADYIVAAAGFVPNIDLYLEACNQQSKIFLIGDAFEVKGIKNALLQAETLGLLISNGSN